MNLIPHLSPLTEAIIFGFIIILCFGVWYSISEYRETKRRKKEAKVVDISKLKLDDWEDALSK